MRTVPSRRKPDIDLHRGTAAALRKAYALPSSPMQSPHVGAASAADEFGALLDQLSNPPPQYSQGAKL